MLPISLNTHRCSKDDTAGIKCKIEVAKSAVAKFNTNVEKGPFNLLNLKNS